MIQILHHKIGDIMFTGTPEGVGKVKIGDFLEGFIDKEKIFEIKLNDQDHF